jgi:hypothetical protein
MQMAHCLKPENYGQTQEKKSNDFIPQRMYGFPDCRQKVPYQQTSLLDALLHCRSLHKPIVTKVKVPGFQLYRTADKLPIVCL